MSVPTTCLLLLPLGCICEAKAPRALHCLDRAFALAHIHHTRHTTSIAATQVFANTFFNIFAPPFADISSILSNHNNIQFIFRWQPPNCLVF